MKNGIEAIVLKDFKIAVGDQMRRYKKGERAAIPLERARELIDAGLVRLEKKEKKSDVKETEA